MTLIEVRKIHDSVDHKWLIEMMSLQSFPEWMSRVVRNLCTTWNTRIVARRDTRSDKIQQGTITGRCPVPGTFY